MTIISAFLAWFLTHRYAIVFPLAILEGPVLTFAGGFLLKLGLFDFWPLYLLIVAGDFTADLLWYAIGRYATEPFIARIGKFFNISLVDVERLACLFRQRHVAAILFSKLTMGFGFALATLVAAGAARIPVRTYAFLTLVGGFAWTAFLLGTGFLVGDLYTAIPLSFRLPFVFVVIALVLASVYGFNRYMRTHVGMTLPQSS